MYVFVVLLTMYVVVKVLLAIKLTCTVKQRRKSLSESVLSSDVLFCPLLSSDVFCCPFLFLFDSAAPSGQQNFKYYLMYDAVRPG